MHSPASNFTKSDSRKLRKLHNFESLNPAQFALLCKAAQIGQPENPLGPPNDPIKPPPNQNRLPRIARPEAELQAIRCALQSLPYCLGCLVTFFLHGFQFLKIIFKKLLHITTIQSNRQGDILDVHAVYTCFFDVSPSQFGHFSFHVIERELRVYAWHRSFFDPVVKHLS